MRCGVWCVVCDTLKNPCVHSTRPRVHVQYVPVCTSTTRTRFNMCAWCRYTQGRFESTHGWRFVHTQGWQGSSLVLLTKICPHMGYTFFRGSPKKPLDLHILRKGRAQSLNAPLLPLQCTHHTKQEHSSDCLFSDLRANSFLLFLLLFFYDDAMRGTTTQKQRPPRHDTPNHPTNNDATHDMTRHHTTKKQRHTRTRTCTYPCHYVCSLSHEKKNGLEHVPSMMCTVPSL